jgi:hypothetical protein
MKRITVLLVLFALALAVASTASAATASTSSVKVPVLRCLCEGSSGVSDTDVRLPIRPGVHGLRLYRVTPTMRVAGHSIPGGVYRAALLDDPGTFGE